MFLKCGVFSKCAIFDFTALVLDKAIEQFGNRNGFLLLWLVLYQGGVKVATGDVKFDCSGIDLGCLAVRFGIWQTNVEPETFALP